MEMEKRTINVIVDADIHARCKSQLALDGKRLKDLINAAVKAYANKKISLTDDNQIVQCPR